MNLRGGQVCQVLVRVGRCRLTPACLLLARGQRPAYLPGNQCVRRLQLEGCQLPEARVPAGHGGPPTCVFSPTAGPGARGVEQEQLRTTGKGKCGGRPIKASGTLVSRKAKMPPWRGESQAEGLLVSLCFLSSQPSACFCF